METINNTITNIINMSYDDTIKFVFMCSGFGYHWNENIDTCINPCTYNFNIKNNYIEIIIDHDYIKGNEEFNYENIVICFNNNKTAFEIRKMNNFLQSQINNEYFSTILIFKLNISFDNIIQQTKNYIISDLQKQNNEINKRVCTCMSDNIKPPCKFNRYGICSEMYEYNNDIINKILSFPLVPINTKLVDFINYPNFKEYYIRPRFGE